MKRAILSAVTCCVMGFGLAACTDHAKDSTKSVSQLIAEVAKTAGAPIKIAAYVRMQLGEGIDKKDDDFAAEVERLSR